MIDAQELEERLAFLGWTEADRCELQELRPMLKENAERFVSAFYRHLLSHAPTRSLLVDPEVKERLIQKQRDYLLSLAGAPIDLDYVQGRMRIGQTHVRVGLEPRWYLGAYSLYFSLLTPLVCEQYHSDPERGQRVLSALMKILMLDAQLAIDAYIERRERELQYLTRELAATSRSLEREYEEAGVELRRTTRRAQAAEELASVATLVAGLAHEIGTPMGVIQGHTELLESQVSDESARARLQTIREQVDRVATLMQTLLNIARPREPVRVPLELPTVIDGTLTFLQEKLRAREIRVEVDLARVPSIRADGEKLQQLFLNLFLNAADSMPDGGTLTVTLAPDGEDGVQVCVDDTGHGIAPEDMERVFEPFYTTKGAGKGSGLGLVVAQGIVRDHGGEISVSSELGRGTHFCIHLPIVGSSASYVPDA